MPSRVDPIQVGARLGQHLTLAVADELRRTRVALGLTQTQVAAAIGVRRVRISQVERAHPGQMTVDHVARHAAVLGLKLTVKLFPVGEPIRDAAQIRYINAFLRRLGHAWNSAVEVPIPIAGDLRAIDIVLRGACVIAVEVVTQLTDVQAVIRAAQLKQRDFGATRLIVVVAGSHANRRALEQARHVLASTFDMDTRRVLSQLAAGRDPGRDAIVVLD